MLFSFIDYGLKDFIRDENDEVLKKEFRTYDDADDFISSGGLEEYGWTNEGTLKWCWNEEL